MSRRVSLPSTATLPFASIMLLTSGPVRQRSARPWNSRPGENAFIDTILREDPGPAALGAALFGRRGAGGYGPQRRGVRRGSGDDRASCQAHGVAEAPGTRHHQADGERGPGGRGQGRPGTGSLRRGRAVSLHSFRQWTTWHGQDVRGARADPALEAERRPHPLRTANGPVGVGDAQASTPTSTWTRPTGPSCCTARFRRAWPS